MKTIIDLILLLKVKKGEKKNAKHLHSDAQNVLQLICGWEANALSAEI